MPVYWLEGITLLSNIALAVDLGIECTLSTVKARVLDLARYQRCSYAAIAVIMVCYLWFFPIMLSENPRTRLLIDKYRYVLILPMAAQWLIADIFIFSFSFTLYKAPRPSIARLAFTAVHSFINMVVLVYIAVLHQILARYLLTVWLGTFQDDWSVKTHNKWWWKLFKWFGGSTPDTSFQDGLVSLARSRMWHDRLTYPFRLLMAGFGLSGKVDDYARTPATLMDWNDETLPTATGLFL